MIKEECKINQEKDNEIKEYKSINKVKSNQENDGKTIKEIPKEYECIYEIIKEKPQHINEISKTANKSITEVTGILTMLELEDLIEQLSGNIFKVKERN